ncbi:MAG TPA: hypothetical protein VEC35_01200 [Noviherbaspirillum sp.]|nr:hypothetical protein [Noviherbaspirillum sp.]
MKGVRWSEGQLAGFEARQKAEQAQAAVKRFQALGRLPKDRMNKTEREYSDKLEAQKAQGLIIDYKFHALRVRLADNTYYEPDFLVLHADMTVGIHETKGGFTTDKGQMKIKLCAEVLPWFRFFKCIKLPAKQGGGWKIEEY